MRAGSSSRLKAILQALLVVTLWSSSWVLIKYGLEDIPPLTFAGLRYFLAFLVLVPFILRGSNRQAIRTLGRDRWLRLGALGLLMYAIGVGGQFVALSFLPAVTTRLLFAFSTVAVALLSAGLLRERPTAMQWRGILAALAGIYVYFHPVDISVSQAAGIAAALVGMGAFTGSALLGRDVARSRSTSPLLVTVVSMGVGSVTLLSCGVALQGMPPISINNWLIILWLSVVNTALAFVLWNHTLRTLTAVESNVITNAMIVEIAVLAWLFLGERLTAMDIVGLGLILAGTVLVQFRRREPVGAREQEPG
jgi:drug/metabolite transporter (DMT)-like permease